MQSLFNSIYRYLLRQRRARRQFFAGDAMIITQPPGTAPKPATLPVRFLPETHGITRSPGEVASPKQEAYQ